MGPLAASWNTSMPADPATTTPKDHSAWNLALRHALDERQRAREARRRLGAALQEQREPDALTGVSSNFADIMRPESKILEEYGLQSDFTFAPFDQQADNTVMQVCAWDEGVPGSTVSGCVNLRSTCNVNTLVEAKDVITPLCVHAVNRRRFETLRAALREQPSLEATLAAVCDVFENHDSVAFEAASAPSDECIPLAGAVAASFVNVHTSQYTARRAAGASAEARDLAVKRVEVSFHPSVGTKIFMAESLRVVDKLSGATSCFVMSNYVPQGAASHVPRTACHLFGLPCNLAGGSANNLLQSAPRGIPRHGHTVIAALAALRSLALRAAEHQGTARAFKMLDADPHLARASVSSCQTHPGLRLVALDVPGGAPGTCRKLCVLLSAVMDCRDMHVAQLQAHLAATAGAAPNVAPLLGAFQNTTSMPDNVAQIRRDVAEIKREVVKMERGEEEFQQAEYQITSSLVNAFGHEQIVAPHSGAYPDQDATEVYPDQLPGLTQAEQKPDKSERETVQDLPRVRDIANRYCSRMKTTKDNEVLEICSFIRAQVTGYFQLKNKHHFQDAESKRRHCKFGLHYLRNVALCAFQKDKSLYSKLFRFMVTAVRFIHRAPEFCGEQARDDASSAAWSEPRSGASTIHAGAPSGSSSGSRASTIRPGSSSASSQTSDSSPRGEPWRWASGSRADREQLKALENRYAVDGGRIRTAEGLEGMCGEIENVRNFERAFNVSINFWGASNVRHDYSLLYLKHIMHLLHHAWRCNHGSDERKLLSRLADKATEKISEKISEAVQRRAPEEPPTTVRAPKRKGSDSETMWAAPVPSLLAARGGRAGFIAAPGSFASIVAQTAARYGKGDTCPRA